MEKITIKELKKQYESVCNNYIEKFCNKQDVYFDGWAGDIIGEMADISDCYFKFSDIVLDVNSKQPKGSIFNWYYNNIESTGDSINYFSYTKGLRISDLKNSSMSVVAS